MNNALTILLLVTGVAFSLLAAVGILRMPDLYTRMQAGSKASTLGVGCLTLAVALHFADLGVTTRALLTIAFLLLTVPIAAHMICRAAYISNVAQWSGTLLDEGKEGEKAESGKRKAALPREGDAGV